MRRPRCLPGVRKHSRSLRYCDRCDANPGGHATMAARLSCVSSVVPSYAVDIDETCRFLLPHAPTGFRPRLERSLRESGNRTRRLVRPLCELARLQGASERGGLYRAHAAEMSERAVGALRDVGLLRPRSITTVIFTSSTGWSAPSLDTHVVRQF